MNVGKKIYGYCNGFFGRDSYSNKRIEAEGPDWIVAREFDEFAQPQFASFKDEQDKVVHINKWMIPTELD